MDYVICPYNTGHKVHGTELRMHLMTCQSKPVKEKENLAGQQPTKKKTKWVALSLKREEEEEERRLEPENQVFDPQDPDRLLQCPYDSNHQIRACRFPYHLIKCKKNHLDLVNQFVTCPFNARHMVPRGELSFHISRCDDKGCIEQDIVDEKSMYKRDVSPSRWNSPPCNEDWDEDLQSERSTFVWGIPSYPVPSSKFGTLMDPKNSLGSNLRAPKSLPYVLPWQMNKS
ncbi:gametocyte-specific factor 1-like [Pseudophryne corroboree]|uniref:gametocyte-specific factor 1-like n=1 Tax=Pseudophryne corroboree TaxID=495146 RepID=UPI0030815840